MSLLSYGLSLILTALVTVARAEPVQRCTAPDGRQTVFFRNGDTARCPADDNVQHFPAAGARRPTLDEVDPELREGFVERHRPHDKGAPRADSIGGCG